jgi:succinoglycan biosynthesis transport protein ExoP
VETINNLQVLDVEYQSQAQIYASLSDQINNLASLGSDFREIERNLELAEVALQGLLAAQQELKLQLEAQSTPWVIVSGYDLTTPLEPKNRLMLGLALSLVASTVLGLGSVLVLEMLDRSYHSADQASDGTQLPLLAMVPWVSQNAPLVPLRYVGGVPAAAGVLPVPADSKPLLSESPASPSSFATAFQTLDANLRLLGGNATLQIVAIASADAMEGKTTIATHLAVASAQAGRKVLLVDGDLRAATVAQRFGLGPPVPKPEAFRPSEARMPEIQSVLDDGTLDVLQGANTHGMAPMGFLASSQFELFLKQCRTHYDLILLDTPTSLDLAETKILSQYADGLLVVIQLGQTDRERVNAALKDFRVASKTPLLGLVANGVETR